MIDPMFNFAVALLFALFWLTAGLSKASDLPVFSRTLAAYDIILASLIPVFSKCIVVIELGIAALLLVPTGRNLGWALSTALLLTYALAMSVNLLRGRHNLDCGCNLGEPERIGWQLVGRNVALVLISSLMILPSTTRILNLGDHLLVVAVTTVLVLLWLSQRLLLQITTVEIGGEG